MQKSHHHLRRLSARPFFAPLSAIVLLAFACFPVAVQAETVYDPEPTTIPGGAKPSPPTATISSPDGSGSASNGKSGGNSAKKGSSADTGSGQGKPGNGSKGKQNQTAQGSDQGDVDLSGAAALTAGSDGGDGGSSSPVVPILIAIAVLAAISMGAVAMRHRRQRSGGPGAQVSPKAG